MKTIVLLFASFIVAVCLPAAFAKTSQPKGYLQATVVSVNKHEQSTTVIGDNPTDAPLPDPETFAYDISVHVNCGTYVGRYQSWYDYVPSLFTPNQKIQLRLTRNMMFVPVPNQKEIEMSIVSKHVERGPCESANTSASVQQ